MKLLAFIQMHNEVEKGNLLRCLENCRQWADDIVIYDDASTDDSVNVARRYTSHIIEGKVNCHQEELFHKQQLLEYAITLSPDWIMWIDCDEILDRSGTQGGLRELTETASPETLAYGFREANLWRSQTYVRTDGPFSTAWFVRLWRVVPKMYIQTAVGLDRPSYPCHITDFVESDFKVIHYHFCEYKRLMWGAGFGYKTKTELQEIAKGNFIFDERNCKCYRIPNEWFPIENVPTGNWPEPKPIPLEDMKVYDDL